MNVYFQITDSKEMARYSHRRQINEALLPEETIER